MEDRTHDKIKDLVEEGALNPLTRLVLTNAIYFKGTWLYQFNENMTYDNPFMLTGEEKVEVPTMSQAEEFSYSENNSCQVLEMPYAGDELSMVILQY